MRYLARLGEYVPKMYLKIYFLTTAAKILFKFLIILLIFCKCIFKKISSVISDQNENRQIHVLHRK